jgi:hypothetical protein
MKASYLKARLLLGTVSLGAGLLAANLALFGWQNPNGFFYLLGEYARYACAYGGFAAMILGAMLINDFLALRNSKAIRRVEDTTTEHEITVSYNLEKDEEKEVVAQ